MGFSLSKIFKPIGQILNGITGVTDTADESYKVSKKLMGMENANNIALWNMQNEYNTPAAQMARMKEAGIDVNPMVYAVGNGNMSSTASSVSTASPHMPNYSSAGNPVSALFSVLNGLEDYENKKLNNRILRKDVKVYEETGLRPSSDGISQFARVLDTHFPGVITAAKEFAGKVGAPIEKIFNLLSAGVDKVGEGVSDFKRGTKHYEETGNFFF